MEHLSQNGYGVMCIGPPIRDRETVAETECVTEKRGSPLPAASIKDDDDSDEESVADNTECFL